MVTIYAWHSFPRISQPYITYYDVCLIVTTAQYALNRKVHTEEGEYLLKFLAHKLIYQKAIKLIDTIHITQIVNWHR